MKMKAMKSMRYNGKALAAGDPFEAVTERDARVLRAIRKAEPDDDESVSSEPAVKPEPAAKPEPAINQKGRYSRRDMRAKN